MDASSYSECVSKLKSGALDAVSTDDLILVSFANQQKGSFKVINDPFTDGSTASASRRATPRPARP